MRVLIVDDSEEMRELIGFVLSNELGLKTVLADSGHSAIEILKVDRDFDLILSDMNMKPGSGVDLFQYTRSAKLDCAFVLLSAADPEEFAGFTAPIPIWIAKPFDIQEMVRKVSRLLNRPSVPSETYVPVALNLLRKMSKIEIPLHIKINDQKYVRISNGPTRFNDEEYAKYEARGVRTLFIESEHTDEFISLYRKNVLSVEAWHEAGSADHEMISLNVEMLKNMASQLGWDMRTVTLAKHSILKSLHLAKSNPNLTSLLNQFHKIEGYGFADHCSLTLMVSVGLLNNMGYPDEISMAKVSFAAILHDMALSDYQYVGKKKTIKKIMKGERMTDDARAILAHSSRAAELCRNWDFCPSGVDGMIAKHHERPDGSGFPSALDANDFDFLEALFVVAEDFADFSIECNGSPDLKAYVQSRDPIFTRGHFRSVFRALETSIGIQLRLRSA